MFTLATNSKQYWQFVLIEYFKTNIERLDETDRLDIPGIRPYRQNLFDQFNVPI